MTPQNPVLDRTLPNGLRLILREDHSAPIASFWTWYRVGSRNELPGLTGISHWVEHMQFKGTPTLAKGQIFRDVSKHGGTLNALTSNDWTAYFETLPVDRLDLALAIESDRMVNSLFDPAETESERTVILSERQGAENNPSYLLYEEVVATAFRAHPYRHMVIGLEPDLRAITRADLYAHYRRHYHPANAFITAVGDFDADDLARRIDRAFGDLPAGDPPPPVRATEPEQTGERRVTLRRPAPTSYLRIGFHAPPARHPDTPPLLVADALLSGGKPMGFGGGGPMGRSSRLYRALVAAGLARAAGSDFDLSVDPSLLVVGVTALPGIEPQRIEAVVDAELARLRDESVPAEELARALKQVQAQYVYSAEGVTNQAFWLGQMEIVDGYRRADTLVDELDRVTPVEVQRVAREYLTPTRRTVGWLFPDAPGGGTDPATDGADPSPSVVPRRRWPYAAGTRGRAEGAGRSPFERTALPSGSVLLGQTRPSAPSVVVRFRLAAGAINDPIERAGLAAFTARMLPRGSDGRSFDRLNEITDSLGASLSVDAGRHFIEATVRCLRADLPNLLDLAAEVLRRPTFPEEEIEKVRIEVLTSIREADDDTRSTADRTLRRLLFPPPHPFGRRVSGDLDTVAAIGRDDLVAFHQRHIGSQPMTVAAVGGFDGLEQVAGLVATSFAGSVDAPAPPTPVPPVLTPSGPIRSDEAIAGKSQADLAVGFPLPSRLDPAYYALDVGNLILGRLGLMGRLGAQVRDRQGLAYYVFSQIEPGREASLWVSRAGVDPGNLERALDAIVDEVRRLRDTAVSSEELDDAKNYLTGILPLALETNDGVAATLLNIDYYDLGLDYLERYPAIIDAITRDDIVAAWRRLDPARLAVAVARPTGEQE